MLAVGIVDAHSIGCAEAQGQDLVGRVALEEDHEVIKGRNVAWIGGVHGRRVSDTQVFSIVGVHKQDSSWRADGNVANIADPISAVNGVGLSNERCQVVDEGRIGLGSLGSVVEEIGVGNSGHGEGSSAVVAQT